MYVPPVDVTAMSSKARLVGLNEIKLDDAAVLGSAYAWNNSFGLPKGNVAVGSWNQLISNRRSRGARSEKARKRGAGNNYIAKALKHCSSPRSKPSARALGRTELRRMTLRMCGF